MPERPRVSIREPIPFPEGFLPVELIDPMVTNVIRDMEVIDPRVTAHCLRVRAVCYILGTLDGLSTADLKEVCNGASIHDIGEILEYSIQEVVRSSKVISEMSEYERALLRSHPERGEARLKDYGLEKYSNCVLFHHEQWNGRGYPRNLCGIEIPRSARMISVSDYWDAVRHERPYKDAMSLEDTYAIALGNFDRGIHDPSLRPLVEEMVSLSQQNKLIFRGMNVSLCI